MDKDKRIGWLRELKVGDKVIIKSQYEHSVKIIDKITSAGKINVGHRQFQENGREKVGKHDRSGLEKWTQEIEDQIKKANQYYNMCEYLKCKDWFQLSFESIESIYKFVKT